MSQESEFVTAVLKPFYMCEGREREAQLHPSQRLGRGLAAVHISIFLSLFFFFFQNLLIELWPSESGAPAPF